MSTRIRGKKELLYPIFEKCSNIVTDEYWKSFYEDLSFGKTPKCLYISNDTIYTTNKKKSFTYSFVNKDEHVIVKELHTLILQNTNLCSNRDLKKKKADIETTRKKIEKTNKITKFSMIKSKNTKELLISNFVIDMKYKYNLSWAQSQLLLSTISIAFICKNLISQDVIYENNKIKSINGLRFYITDDGIGNFKLLNDSNLKDEDTVRDNLYLYKIWNKKSHCQTKGKDIDNID